MLGVAVGDLRLALYNAYGDRQIGSIYGASNTYQVILSAADSDRQFEDDVSRLSVRSATGRLVPLSAFSTVKRTVGPIAVNHQGQLQAVTVSFNLAPDVPLGNATAKIDQFNYVTTLFITTNLSIGYTFSTIAQNQLQAMQMSMMFFLPNILLSGFMFPFAGMPDVVQWGAELLPMTQFLRLIRARPALARGRRVRCRPDRRRPGPQGALRKRRHGAASAVR